MDNVPVNYPARLFISWQLSVLGKVCIKCSDFFHVLFELMRIQFYCHITLNKIDDNDY